MVEEDTVAADLPAHLGLCADIVAQAKVVSDSVAALCARLEDEDAAAADKAGMSFLQLKNVVMLDYLSNLCYVALRKATGKSIRDDDAVERLVTDRTVLEKMRPLEQKLKYQIDKAVKVAESGKVAGNDPIHFKANPKDMISRLGDDEDEDEDDEDEDEDGEGRKANSSSSKYVAPRNVPAYFEEGTSREEAEEEASRSQKKRLLSKSMIEDLRRQHLDTPEEVHEHETAMRRRQADAAKERTRYEEDNFVRLPMSKKERHTGRLGRMSTVGSIGDEVTAFGRNFFSDQKKGSSGGRKRKSFGKSKKSGGGFAKKKKFKH